MTNKLTIENKEFTQSIATTTKGNKTVKHVTVDSKVFKKAQKVDLIVYLTGTGMELETAKKAANKALKVVTERSIKAEQKRNNTASIKVVSSKLTLARKLNATLNSTGDKKWDSAIEAYNKYYGEGHESIGKREVKRRILALIEGIVTLEGFEA